MALDRRGFLRLAGAVAGGAALSGCGLRSGSGDSGADDPDGLTFTLWGGPPS